MWAYAKNAVTRHGLGRRFLAAVCLMILPAVLIAAVGVRYLVRDKSNIAEGLRETRSEAIAIDAQRTALAGVEAPALGVLWAGTNTVGAEYDAKVAAINARFDVLSRGLDSAAEQRSLNTAKGQWRQAVTYLASIEQPTVADPVAATPVLTVEQQHYRVLLAASVATINHASVLSLAEAGAAFSQLGREHQLALLLVVGLLAAGLTLAVAAAHHLRRRILGRLRRLEHGALELSAGHLTYRIEMDGNDEITDLAVAFDTMAANLERFAHDLNHQAMHDPLTGLANRRLFSDRLEHALARQRRDDRQLAVLVLDLDRFKTVNDALGHMGGDELLRVIGTRITNCVSAGDSVARMGGDEFAVLLEDLSSPDHAEAVAARILSSVSGDIAVGGARVSVSISVGIAMLRESESTRPDDLLQCADLAMYAAKRNGRGRSQRYSPEMRVNTLARLTIERELRRACENHEFTVHYQPIVDVLDGHVVAVEALVRWRHPVRGTLAPAEFLDVAEETGLISDIGWEVLEIACRDGNTHLGDGTSMHVNLSVQQLEESDAVAHARRILDLTGFPPNRLVLELTESEMLDPAESIPLRLRQLRQLGVRIGIDDFGTGYSSLSTLHNLPIDVLKIDKTFIDALTDGDPGRAAIVSAVISMAQTLHLDAIAEGVETAAQAIALERLGASFIQGFLYARPMPIDEIDTYVLSHTPPILTASPTAR